MLPVLMDKDLENPSVAEEGTELGGCEVVDRSDSDSVEGPLLGLIWDRS